MSLQETGRESWRSLNNKDHRGEYVPCTLGIHFFLVILFLYVHNSRMVKRISTCAESHLDWTTTHSLGFLIATNDHVTDSFKSRREMPDNCRIR